MSTPDRERRLRRAATAMGAVTLVLAVGLVAATIATWLGNGWPQMPAGAAEPGATQRILALAIGLPILGVMLWALWNAFHLFRAYRAGGVLFRVETGQRLRRIGVALLVVPLVSVVTNAVNGVVLTWHIPQGRQLAIGISSDAILLLIVGAIVTMIGWTMTEAARIADEHRQFV